jgi:hypothetical protein
MSQRNPAAASMSAGLFEGSTRKIRALTDEDIAITVENLDLYYGDTKALKGSPWRSRPSASPPSSGLPAAASPRCCAASTA